MFSEDLDVWKMVYGGKIINYYSVAAAFSEGIIEDLNNQTFFKNEDGTPASLIDVAVKKKDTKLVKFLLKHRVIPNPAKYLGRSLLLWVMDDSNLSKDIILIKKLIDAGEDIECQDTDGKDYQTLTPLLRSVAYGNIEVIKFLINYGANINPPCLGAGVCYECSPLSQAMYENHYELVDILIKSGANINHVCESWGTPLHAACWSSSKLVQRLLDLGANINDLFPDNCFSTTIGLALEQDDPEMLKILLNNHGIDLDYLYGAHTRIIHDVVASDNLTFVHLLLNTNPDVNIFHWKNKLAIDQINNNCLKAGEVLKKHIVRLRAAGFYLHERNVEAVSGKEYSDLYAECCQQVEAMKKSKISPKSHFSVYDLLFMTREKLALCLESLDDPDILKSRLHKKFPLYAGMIKFTLVKAYQYVELRDVVRASVFELFDNYLPTTIMDEIFTYFNFNDMVELWKKYKKRDSTPK